MTKKNVAIMAMFILSVFVLLITVVFFEVKNYNEAKNVNDTTDLTASSEEAINDQDKSANNELVNDISVIDKSANESKNDGSNDFNKTNKLNNDNSETNLNIDNTIKMVFAGDFYFSGYILQKYNQNGVNGILSANLQQDFKNADIAMVNEEFPFSDRGKKMEDKQFTFRISPSYVDVLKKMNIDIVTLANNHILDYGTDALLDTLDTLGNANIQYVGAGTNIEEAQSGRSFRINDKNVAILAASRVIPVTSWNATSSNPGVFTTYDPNILNRKIAEAKKENDFVIVYVHWGIERHTKPEEYQRQLAKSYIDSGADVVIGSHPHVLQGMEYYKNKPIIYSLGNFMFYDSIERTALLKIEFDRQNNIHVVLVPCYAENSKTSEITNENEKINFYSYMKSISFQIDIDNNGNVYEIN